MKAPELVDKVVRTVPDLDRVIERLRDDPEGAVAHAVRRPARERAATVGVPHDELPPELQDPERDGRARVLDAARRAAEKIRRDGVDADFEPDEVPGVEAIIVVEGRPAILIQDGKFFFPPEGWSKLEDRRAEIEAVFPSVGRIEVTGHPRFEWVGTGWMAGPGVVITNRHVAKEFSRPVGKRWEFEPGMKARIDFAEEFGGTAPREFPITDVLAVHTEIDLAVLKVGSVRGKTLPPPLPIATRPATPKKGREVYVVGYPAADPGRNDPEVMARIFNNIYNVKRLQPGEVAGNKQSLHSHDCSTLGGNSGSCVVDLDTHRVIGLHFQGRFLEANWAVTMAKVRSDPAVRKADLHFVQ